MANNKSSNTTKKKFNKGFDPKNMFSNNDSKVGNFMKGKTLSKPFKNR